MAYENHIPYRVHIGFGFHVNCYHSYRGDTPDVFGFGGDIRVIRGIIDVLDRWNAAGVPVKGTWDFENAYSLEEILPRYAPDIIENVRRRQQENGDENILMGYNNGAMSAMTEEEFLASIDLAITNEKGSGLRDVFGDYAPVIRPQEVMFTPSQAALYKKAGIEAVCLYYSCVSFDAFRTLIPQLQDEAAFNPLRYRYADGDVTILPTYSHSDILDAGSLRWLVTDLHRQQAAGTIMRDVFLFINMDADSMLWESMNLPASLSRIPNTGGLDGLIREVADLPFITFDTPGRYLKSHPPVQDIFFGQDTADGNFSGYSSWAEKPFNRQIWTRLERARLLEEVCGKSEEAFAKRIRLLSTTHFGLASPVLNITREKTALALSASMLEDAESGKKHGGELTLRSSKPQSIFCAQLAVERGACPDITRLHVTADGLKTFAAVSMGHHEDGSVSSVYLVCVLHAPTDRLVICAEGCGGGGEVSCERERALTVTDDGATGFPVLVHEDSVLAKTESYLVYRNRRVPFAPPTVTPLAVAGQGYGTRFSGEIHLPGEERPGRYQFDFFHVQGISPLFLRTYIQYPYTRETHEISTQASNLGRFTDNNWTEVCPLAFLLTLDETASVIKRNFMDDLSGFPVSGFRNAFPENANMDAFNNQLTGGILAASDRQHGLAIAHARAVLGSMAHCPMRLRSKGEGHILALNPFGTYYGKQRHYPSRGNGCVMDLYNATMPQAQSLAPAYNGVCEQSVQALQWTQGADFDRETLTAIADGAVVSGGSTFTAFCEDNVAFPVSRSSENARASLPATSARLSKWRTLLRGGTRLVKTMLKAQKMLKKEI